MDKLAARLLVRLECLPQLPQIRIGAGQVQPVLEGLKNGSLPGFVRMDFQAEVPEAKAVEPALHHLERSHLLGHEQDSLPTTHRRGNDIRDGLRFSRSRWSLDHREREKR